MIKFLSSSAVLLVALPAMSQMGPGDYARARGPMGFGNLRTPVTNAPYSATFTSTSTEKLQDGTVLNSSSTRVVERDSLGRTREEVTTSAHGEAKPHTMVVIFDPVAHTVTQLRTGQKVAIVHAMQQPDGGGPGAHHAGPSEAANGTGAAGADSRPSRRENKDVVRTDLGAKTISGVVANGTRITRTTPAGEMGNAAPIVSTHEEWYSPDLNIEVSRTDVDPFHGTHTTAASSLSRAEPDPALFKVPSDFKLEQAPGRVAGRRGFGGPHGSELPAAADGTTVPSGN